MVREPLMKYDFIDIGCAHFDVSVDQFGLSAIGLLVEPIEEYCNVLPSSETVLVECAAITEKDGECEFIASISKRIEYLPSSLILNPVKLRRYQERFGNVAGLGTFNNRDEWYGMDHIPRTVKTLSLKSLFEKYDVSSIGQLKIDVEGHESVILKQLIPYLQEGMAVHKLIFEYNDMSDLKELDTIIDTIKTFGYNSTFQMEGWNEDIIMEKL